jgi:hypothetical protein
MLFQSKYWNNVNTHLTRNPKYQLKPVNLIEGYTILKFPKISISKMENVLQEKGRGENNYKHLAIF